MDIIGKTKIFRKEFNGKPIYSRAISAQEYKDGQKGNWISAWENVQFPQGADIPDRSIVKIKGFESVYKSKDGVKRKLVVQEYAVIDATETKDEAPKEGFTKLADDDIPF